jgi:hypothetical protein
LAKTIFFLEQRLMPLMLKIGGNYGANYPGKDPSGTHKG